VLATIEVLFKKSVKHLPFLSFASAADCARNVSGNIAARISDTPYKISSENSRYKKKLLHLKFHLINAIPLFLLNVDSLIVLTSCLVGDHCEIRCPLNTVSKASINQGALLLKGMVKNPQRSVK